MCYVWFNKRHNSTHAMPFGPVNSFFKNDLFLFGWSGSLSRMWTLPRCGEQVLLSSGGAGPLAAAASCFGAQALGVVGSGL